MTRRSGPSEILRYSHLGIQFAVVVLAAIWAGNWLDRRLSTGFFTLVGTFLGAGIGFYLLYRELYGRGRDREDGGPSSPDSGGPVAGDAPPRDPGRRPHGSSRGE